jgi:PilZ domain
MNMTNTSGMPDRRKSPRFQVALRVELPEGTGVTRDLSPCGIFFETDCVFALGQTIQFALVFEHIDPGQPVLLRCRGRVVRVERRGDITGVAVAVTAYRLGTGAHGGMGVLCPTAQ